MSYFPAYIDLNSKKILIVGGGNIALEKLEKLLDFSQDITILATKIDKQIYSLAKSHNLNTIEKSYQVGDIDGFDIVIVATDTIDLHKKIYSESRGKGILVNSVDDTRYCDFIFPSYIKRGDLIISFSTSGASPAFAKHIKRYFQNIIPPETEEFLKKMKRLRETLPKGRERMREFDKMAKEFIERAFRNR